MRTRFHDQEEIKRKLLLSYMKGNIKVKRWCKKHTPSIWADGYKQCSKGWKLKEECEEGETHS
jgi:hypothetical protein